MAQPILGIAPGTRPREAAKQQIVLEMLDFLPSHPCLVKKMVSDIADMLAKVYLDKELCFFSDTHSQNVSIPSSVFGEKNLIISSPVAHLFSF